MTLQVIESIAEADHRREQASELTRDRAIKLAEAGAPLSAVEFAAIERIGISQFHKKAKRGIYDDFKLRPTLGPKCYSGVVIARYLRGEAIQDPISFGRKRVR